MSKEMEHIIVTIHNAGLELVTIHDRPDGSALGSYRYIIETENPNGVTEKQIGKVCEPSRRPNAPRPPWGACDKRESSIAKRSFAID